MTYCLNPACANPENPRQAAICQACGAPLLLRDRYRATQLLAKGGFGTTFLAVDVALPGHPACVIKQLRPATHSPQILEMARALFEREAKTLGKLGSHPQLPRLLDYFELGQEFCLVQEYVGGLTLQQEVKRSGPMDEAGVCAVLQELLPVLGFLQRQEVIHRDIKPANIIRRQIDGKLVLIDFGAVKDQVSQLASLSATGDTALTNFAVGTPGFSPPEQVAMRPVYASDIYALGMTCVYLLTGKNPQELGYDPITSELRWRDRLALSESFAALLNQMLADSVRDRFQSAQAVLQALELASQSSQLAQGLDLKPSGLRSFSRGVIGRSAALGSRSLRAGVQSASTSELRLAVSRSARPSGLSQFQARRLVSETKTNATKMDAAGLQAAYRQGRRDFTDLDLRSLNLRHFNLSQAIFHQAQMQRVNLESANLLNANLGKVNLAGANLRGAQLSKAYLSYANLEGADLEGADLSQTYLNGANLQGANLQGANLQGAKISDQQLAEARTNWKTILPNGKKASWWR